MTTWKQQLERYNFLLEQIAKRKEKNEGELRFSRCTVRASDVAGQYYCEKKIELEYLYGEVETRTENRLAGATDAETKSLLFNFHGG